MKKMSRRKFIVKSLIAVASASIIYSVLNWAISGLYGSQFDAQYIAADSDLGTALDKVAADPRYVLNWGDHRVQDAIHLMSHQKVKAVPKWGAIELTHERVVVLLNHVYTTTSLEHRAIYLDILERWEAEDFSQAVDDHNKIWRLQGGTVGKAFGLYSPQEEERYVKNNFRK